MHWLIILLLIVSGLVAAIVTVEYTTKRESLIHVRTLSPRTQGYRYETAHFVYGLWDTSPIPEGFVKTMDAWRLQGWKTKLWNLEMVNGLFEKYPEYKDICKAFSRRVQLADLARLLILYDEGGHYFDLDCIPSQRNLHAYLNDTKPAVVFYIEALQGVISSILVGLMHKVRRGRPEFPSRVANYAFGARAKHPIIKENLDLLKRRCEMYKDCNTDYDIIYKTGPDCTTSTVVNSKHDSVTIDHLPWMIHSETGTWRRNLDDVSLKS